MLEGKKSFVVNLQYKENNFRRYKAFVLATTLEASLFLTAFIAPPVKAVPYKNVTKDVETAVVVDFNEQIPRETVVEIPVDPLSVMIPYYSNVYDINEDTINMIYEINKNEINSNKFPSIEAGLLEFIREYYKGNDTIDKTPIIEDNTNEDFIRIITKYGMIYGFNDNEISQLIAIHNWESQYGSSLACQNKNNQGGLQSQGQNLSYRTDEIGCIEFVRNTYLLKQVAMKQSYYNENESLLFNINPIYCPPHAQYVKQDGVWVYSDKPLEGIYWYKAIMGLTNQSKDIIAFETALEEVKEEETMKYSPNIVVISNDNFKGSIVKQRKN